MRYIVNTIRKQFGKILPKKKSLEEERIDYIYNLKIYIDLLSRYKGLVFLLIMLSLLLEIDQTADKFLFKIIIDNGAKFIAGTASTEAFVRLLIIIAVIFAFIFLLRAFLKWIHLHIINRLDANLIRELKQKFFNHIIHLSHRFHTTHKTGSLISRLNRGGGAIERMTDLLVFNALPLIFQLIIVFSVTSFFSSATAIVIILTALAFLVYSFIIQQMQKNATINYNRAEDIEKAHIADFFTNADTIKYFGKERFVKERFSDISNNTSTAAINSWNYYRWLDAGQSIILGIGTFFLFYFPLVDFLHNRITLGSLAFIYIIYGNLTGPLLGFVRAIRDYYRSMADFNDLFQYGKVENDIKDSPSAIPLTVKYGKIEFKEVSFAYHNRRVVTDLSLTIKPGEKVAVVGRSGSGKTTIIKLLYRFYDVDRGKILIDGTDIKDLVQESLRSELSIVPQEGILFDDTIYNNILFSNPKAKRADVTKAIKFAQLDSLIEMLPERENTVVGERGVKLSGGERQRVSLARALLADKRILILDEATSALDSHTEQEIQKDIEKLMKGKTSIIIAHRLSTIMKADKIVVLDKGKIAQIGPHEKLISKPGIYKKLWDLQRGGYLQ